MFSHYRKPLVTWTARPFFLGGVSLARAQLWSACWGLVLVVAAAGLARTVWGGAAAWLATCFVGLGVVFVGYGRAAVVYGPLAASVTLVAWLHAAARRRVWLEAAAIGALVALALVLKENAIIALPALLVSSAMRLRRPGRWLLGAAVVGAPALLALAWCYDPHLVRLGWAKLHAYVAGRGALDSCKRWLRTPFASGIVRLEPLVAVIGWCGVLAALRRGAPEHGEQARARRRAEWMLALWAVGWFAFHGWFEYLEGGPPPMRHMVGGLVPLALLAAGVLARVAACPEGALVSVHPLVWGTWSLFSGYWALGSVWTAAAARWPAVLSARWVQALVRFEGLVASALVLAAGSCWWLARRRWRVQLTWPPAPRRALVGMVVLGAAALGAWRFDAMVFRPGWTLREANRRVAALLNEGAQVYGPWAHALTWSAARVRPHLPPHDVRSILERSTRMTHLVIDWAWLHELGRQYAHNGIALRRLERLSVRGHAIGVFLYPWAFDLGYRPSPLERARLDMHRRAGGRETGEGS